VRWLGAVARLAGRAAALAETRLGLALVFVAALVVWWLEALVIPLAPGRDFYTYVGAYVQLFWSNPIDLGYVLGRTPLSPLLVGGVLDPAHGALAEPAMSLLYAASVTAWFLAARAFGGGAALLTAVVMLLYPGYGILFHELSSDPASAAAFAGWSLVVVRAVFRPSVAKFALVGAGVGVLALVRPGNQVLLVFAVLPLLVALSWRRRLASLLAFVVCAAILLGAWTVHNGVLWNDYTFARGGNTGVPFYRAFLVDRIVEPDNGPASRELADAVRRDLLPEEPYRAYGIDLHEFFSEATPRMEQDLVALSNRVWGWKSDGRKLREVGIEAVRAHPSTYAKGVSKTMWQLLRQPVYRALPPAGGGGGGKAGATETIIVNGRRLPKPTEGELIPAPHEGAITTPDGSIYTVWTSPKEHHVVFAHPGDRERNLALHERMDQLGANLPDRGGNGSLTLRLNQSSRWYPPPFVWLALGIVGLVARRPARALALAAPAVAALVVIVLSALGLPAVPHYSLPVAPAFVLLAAGALLGPRARTSAHGDPEHGAPSP
jgi:hypothetical protein